MNDLVDRLRTVGEDYDFHENALIFAAADEIKRLRTKLEAAEKNNSSWLYANAPGGWIDNLRVENEALRAKIEVMERQEPVARVWRCDNGHIHGSCESELLMGQQLYALPGAKGEEK